MHGSVGRRGAMARRERWWGARAPFAGKVVRVYEEFPQQALLQTGGRVEVVGDLLVVILEARDSDPVPSKTQAAIEAELGAKLGPWWRHADTGRWYAEVLGSSDVRSRIRAQLYLDR